ncbi:MAG: tetratricopeptide repeat protein [Bacteroidales bacterium]|nr:tetratricopeptide repeat protein [Bacteroidales bacterium]
MHRYIAVAVRVVGLCLLLGPYAVAVRAQQPMPEAYYRLLAALEGNQAELAQRWADSCAQLRPQRLPYLLGRGRAALLAERYADAAELFREVERRRRGEGSLWLARCLAAMGDTAASLAQLAMHLEGPARAKESDILLDPYLRPLHTSEGWRELWSADHYTAVEHLLARAEYLSHVGHHDEALELLNARIRGSRGRYALFALRGDAHLALGGLGAALADYRVAYRKSKLPKYLGQMALVLALRGQHGAAIRQAHRAVQRSGGDPKLHLLRAQVLFRAGQNAMALSDLSLFCGFYPAHEAATEMLAESALAAGQHVTALQALAKLIKLHPDSPKLRYMRGLVLLRTDQHRLAIADFDFAIQHDHQVASSYYGKGLAHRALGEHGLACTCLSVAAQRGSLEAQELHFKHCR